MVNTSREYTGEQHLMADAAREAAKAAQEHADAVQREADMQVQAAQQLGILQNIDAITGAQAGLNSIFDFGAASLKNYDLTAGQTLALYQALGLETGNLTAQQIAQSQTLNELNNLWVSGMIGADQYAASITALQQGVDASKVSLDAQGAAIRALAQQYINEGVPAYQAMAQATQDVGSKAAGTTLTLEEAKTKISELSEVVAKAAEIQPADISINSNAPVVAEGVASVTAEWATLLLASGTPADVKVKDGTVVAGAEHIATVTDTLAALDGNEATIFVNIVTTGEIPSVPGGTTTSGGGKPGGKAGGGPVKKGVPYVTGEEGYELFIPQTDGVIVPHNATKQLLNPSGASGQGGPMGGPVYNLYGQIHVHQAPGATLADLLQEQVAT